MKHLVIAEPMSSSIAFQTSPLISPSFAVCYFAVHVRPNFFPNYEVTCYYHWSWGSESINNHTVEREKLNTEEIVIIHSYWIVFLYHLAVSNGRLIQFRRSISTGMTLEANFYIYIYVHIYGAFSNSWYKIWQFV